MDDFKKIQMKHIGVGGIKCPCCNVFHSKNKDFRGKKTYRRYARRKMKEKTSNYEKQEKNADN